MIHSKSIFNAPILGRGFRPFFMLAALHSITVLLLWAAQYGGYITPQDTPLSAMTWHAHEMIYGFAIAVVAGFLLTAIANWTGTPPIRNGHLFFLCCLWVLGRIAMSVDLGLPYIASKIITLSFLPVLAISLARPLIATKNKRNFIFLALLSILWAAQIVMLCREAHTASYIGLMVIIVMTSLIGGRVIPMFTVNGLRQAGIIVTKASQTKLDIWAILSLLMTTGALIFMPSSIVLTFSAFVSALIHLIRMRNYHSLKTLAHPMLWILHAGYFWIIIGLVLLGLSALNIVTSAIAIHAFSTGALGSFTLGMMVRVSLGHTGRSPMKTRRLIVFSFVLMQVSAIMRVFGTMLAPEHTGIWVSCSAILWSICFALFLIVFTPMLISPRPDGQTP